MSPILLCFPILQMMGQSLWKSEIHTCPQITIVSRFTLFKCPLACSASHPTTSHPGPSGCCRPCCAHPAPARRAVMESGLSGYSHNEKWVIPLDSICLFPFWPTVAKQQFWRFVLRNHRSHQLCELSEFGLKSQLQDFLVVYSWASNLPSLNLSLCVFILQIINIRCVVRIRWDYPWCGTYWLLSPLGSRFYCAEIS